MSGSFGNKKKDSFLSSIPVTSLDSDNDLLTTKCKFNFAYFTVQSAGQDFPDWDATSQCHLYDCLKEYSASSLDYWIAQNRLVVYGAFPKRSDFQHPPHVPHQVHWARFRLGSAVRLVGFMIPGEFHDKYHQKTGKPYDKNTFYVVFLDADHRFYKTEKK